MTSRYAFMGHFDHLMIPDLVCGDEASFFSRIRVREFSISWWVGGTEMGKKGREGRSSGRGRGEGKIN